MRTPPGHMGWPIIGETLALFRDPYRYGQRRFAQYGEVSRARLIFRPAVMLLSARGQQWALVEAQADLSAREGYALIQDLFADAILLPIFAPKHVETMRQTINRVIDYRLHTWRDGQTVVLLHEFEQMAFTLGCAILLGIMPDDPRIPLWSQHWHRFAAGEAAVFRYRLPFTKYGRAHAARRWMMTQLHELVTSQKHAQEPNIIKLLAEAGMPDAAIITQIIFLIDASFETTANTATWICCELLQHPAYWQALHETIGTGPPLMSEADVQQKPFIDALINETLRLHPQVMMFGRRAMTDLVYTAEDGTQFTIPKGSLVHLNPTFVHRRPDYWTDPDAFIPDRFVTRQPPVPPTGSWMGFGGGVHGCLGEPIARFEIAAFLTAILRRFDLTLVPDQDLRQVYRLLSQPKSGALVIVHARRGTA
jgi:retinoid hydroxylase